MNTIEDIECIRLVAYYRQINRLKFLLTMSGIWCLQIYVSKILFSYSRAFTKSIECGIKITQQNSS